MGLTKPDNEVDTSTLAQESTSQEIKNIAGGVQTDIDTLQTEINALKEAISDIKTTVEQIASGGSSSVIRRIQRGTFSLISDERKISLTGFKNLNKMMVILNSYGETSSDYIGNPVYVSGLTLNTLTISGIYGTKGSYQVIEFY